MTCLNIWPTNYLWLIKYSGIYNTNPLAGQLTGLRHRFFAAEINLGRNIELLVFFYHANNLGGIEMINPRLAKSKIFEIEISVFLVAIGAKHRFG